MRVGGSDFGCWANVSSLPLSRDSRGHDGKIEEVGKWFAKQCLLQYHSCPDITSGLHITNKK